MVPAACRGGPGLARGYRERVDILLWLVPPAVATLLAMVWVTWLGREGRGEVDRDVAVRRMGEALQRPLPARRQAAPVARPRERSTGIAVRRDSPLGKPAGAPGVRPETRRSA